MIVGYIRRKPVPTHAISVMDIGGNGEYGDSLLKNQPMNFDYKEELCL